MRPFLAVAAIALVGACPQRRFEDLDTRRIESTLNAQRDAWNRGDLDAFMSAYAKEGLVFTSGGEIRRGWDETLARYRKRYGDRGAMGKLDFSELEITGLGPDAALVLGRWRLTETPESGEGVFTLVLERDASGAWTIVHDHTSARKP